MADCPPACWCSGASMSASSSAALAVSNSDTDMFLVLIINIAQSRRFACEISELSRPQHDADQSARHARAGTAQRKPQLHPRPSACIGIY